MAFLRIPFSSSANGSRVGYGAGVGDQRFVVVDGVRSEPFDAVFAPIIFSADGTRVAFGCRRKNVCSAVVDGVLHGTFETLLKDLLFSPDGKRLAYGGRHRESRFLGLQKRGLLEGRH